MRASCARSLRLATWTRTIFFASVSTPRSCVASSSRARSSIAISLTSSFRLETRAPSVLWTSTCGEMPPNGTLCARSPTWTTRSDHPGFRYLFHAIGVSKRVECVFARTLRRGDVGDHHRSRVAEERVPEHLGQFGSTKRDVRRAGIERSYALFERQERLIDLRALDSGLTIVICRVRAAFASG